MLFLLTGSAIYFTKDSNELILSPIERMLSTVKNKYLIFKKNSKKLNFNFIFLLFFLKNSLKV
jgi:hypothetical protein